MSKVNTERPCLRSLAAVSAVFSWKRGGTHRVESAMLVVCVEMRSGEVGMLVRPGGVVLSVRAVRGE